MASRAVRSVASRVGQIRGLATSTAPRGKPYGGSMASEFGGQPQANPKASSGAKGDYIPVFVSLGFIGLSVSLGLYTAKQQLAYSPSVFVSKKKRETIPEVEDPDYVVEEAEKFVDRSAFRKVAHVQDFDRTRAGINDPTRPAPFHRQKTVETLKSVGVDPHLAGH